MSRLLVIMIPVFAAMSATAAAQMRITEWMYNGTEFIEFTNVGGSVVDMTGWSYSDEDEVPGTIDLSAFGTVQPGESVILCEDPAGDFIDAWGLSGIAVIGMNLDNLGRNDAINLYDDADQRVDSLDFGDQEFPGSIRTSGDSGWPCHQSLGADDVYGWRLSTVGDEQGSYASVFPAPDFIGNPGIYTAFTCPAQSSGACCAAGTCSIETEAECAGQGLYQGDGTDCNLGCPSPSGAIVRITEFMHGGFGAEFIEFTNLDSVAVDMTGWSYSDEGRIPGDVDLSGFGAVAPGESVILTEALAGAFAADWSLSGVAIIGENPVNIGGNDEINLYDHSGAKVDTITYGDLTDICSVDADTRSGWPCADAVGENDILEWRIAAPGDGQGSGTSAAGDVGNPGSYVDVVCGSGACCHAGGCTIDSYGGCLTGGGVYLGDTTSCGGDPCPAPSNADIRITEYMYTGIDGEFAEFTNFGGSAIDMSGWSFADACLSPGIFVLTGLGSVQPGESVVMTDMDPATFRASWGLAASVQIHQLPSGELGRNDSIHLYADNGALVDSLEYGDQRFPGTVQTNEVSAWGCLPAVGGNQIQQWALSALGDAQDSTISSNGNLGSPGAFAPVPCSNGIPTVSEWGMVITALVLLAAGTIVLRLRRRACGA